MATQRPNIILITTDQQRGDCLGIEGRHPVMTPNLDALARSGCRFTRAYTECPSCIPARRVLMTGQAPWVNGMVGMTADPNFTPTHTLPGELGKAGYHTQLVGKLHLQPQRRRFGFDNILLSDLQWKHDHMPHNDYVDWLEERGGAPPVPGMAHGIDPNGWVARPSHQPEQEMHSFWCVSEAIKFLDRRDPNGPFFLNLSFIDPHPPLTPPAHYYDRYMAMDLPEPVIGDWAEERPEPEKGLATDAWRLRIDKAAMKSTRAGYYGLINFVDDQIGRLIFALRIRGLYRNLVIVFTSDHGEMLGDHNMFRKTFGYEGSAHVPFIVWATPDLEWPSEVVSDAPVGLQDIMPTVLDAAGVATPDDVTGRSLLPLVRRESDDWREHIHGEHAGHYEYADGVHYLVSRSHKYLWFSQTGAEQFFDLVNDPDELHDIAREPNAETQLRPWRDALMHVLRDRPEGFTDGARLIPGRPHINLIRDVKPAR